MRVLIVILALTFGSLDAATAVARPNRIDAQIDMLVERLPAIWKSNIRDAIDQVPAYSGSADDLELVYSDGCRLAAEYDRTTSPRSVRLDRQDILGVVILAQQAMLFYLLDVGMIDKPSDLDDYVTGRLVPFVEARAEACIADDLSELSVGEFERRYYFVGRGYDPSQVVEFFRSANAKPKAELLGDQVGGLPVFFALIHEAGHHYHHKDGPTGSVEDEFLADDFAIDVFDANRTAATMGIPFLQLFATGRRKSEVECRIARIAQSDKNIAIEMQEFPRAYTRRLQALRDFYVEQYEKACG